MWKKAKYILLAAVLTGLMPLGLFVLDRYVVPGLNHFLPSLLGLLGLVVLVFFVLLIIRWFYSRKPGRPDFAPADWFLSAALGWMAAGILYDGFAATSNVTVQLEDTYFVLANFYMFDALAVLFGLAAAFYYLLPVIGGRPLGAVPGHIHFWVSFTGTLLLVYVSRMLWVEMAVLAAQGVFVFNLVYSALRRRN